MLIKKRVCRMSAETDRIDRAIAILKGRHAQISEQIRGALLQFLQSLTPDQFHTLFTITGKTQSLPHNAQYFVDYMSRVRQAVRDNRHPEALEPEIQGLEAEQRQLAFPHEGELKRLNALGAHDMVEAHVGDYFPGHIPRLRQVPLKEAMRTFPLLEERRSSTSIANAAYFSWPASLVMRFVRPDYMNTRAALQYWNERVGEDYFESQNHLAVLRREQQVHEQEVGTQYLTIGLRLRALREEVAQFSHYQSSIGIYVERLPDKATAAYLEGALAHPEEQQEAGKVFGTSEPFAIALALGDRTQQIKTVLDQLGYARKLLELKERLAQAAATEAEADTTTQPPASANNPSPTPTSDGGSRWRYRRLQREFAEHSRGVSWDQWHSTLNDQLDRIEELERERREQEEKRKTEEARRLEEERWAQLARQQVQMSMVFFEQQANFAKLHEQFMRYQHTDQVSEYLASQRTRERGRSRERGRDFGRSM